MKRRRKKRIQRHRPGKSARVRAKTKRRRRRDKRDLWRGIDAPYHPEVLEAIQSLLPIARAGIAIMKSSLGKLGVNMADLIERTADRVEREPWMAFDCKLPPADIPAVREVAKKIRLGALKTMLPDGVPEEV
jgi:hypothetical protein